VEQREFCPVHAAIQVLQEKWVLHIVRTLLEGPRGFNDLSRSVGGINPATLAVRLERLERMGLVSKTVHSYMPPRTTYALTDAGVALHAVIDSIGAWGRRYLRVGAAGEPICSGSAKRAEPAPSR
jgi:DNA-binding HxlR family transcriptional regulator